MSGLKLIFLSLVAAVQLTIANQSRNPVHIRHAQLKAGEFAEKLPELIKPDESIFIKVRKVLAHACYIL